MRNLEIQTQRLPLSQERPLCPQRQMPSFQAAARALGPGQTFLAVIKTDRALLALTFLGMVGIYIGAYLAYQKYQAYQAKLQQQGTLGGS